MGRLFGPCESREEMGKNYGEPRVAAWEKAVSEGYPEAESLRPPWDGFCVIGKMHAYRRWLTDGTAPDVEREYAIIGEPDYDTCD